MTFVTVVRGGVETQDGHAPAIPARDLPPPPGPTLRPERLPSTDQPNPRFMRGERTGLNAADGLGEGRDEILQIQKLYCVFSFLVIRPFSPVPSRRVPFYSLAR